MKTVLFGSPYNPLSGVAARFFYEKKELALVVLPSAKIAIFNESILHGLSLLILGGLRLAHVFLRKYGFKKSDSYLSLKEYLVVHRDIRTVEFVREADELQQAILQAIGDPVPGGVRAVSCIFPHKIPVSLPIFDRMINIHPGVLPQNRGPNPYFWVLAEKLEAGITGHVLSSQMDAGDILLCEVFRFNGKLSEFGLERVTVKQLNGFLIQLFGNIDELWNNKSHQTCGNYMKKPTLADRVKYKRKSVLNWKDLCAFINI